MQGHIVDRDEVDLGLLALGDEASSVTLEFSELLGGDRRADVNDADLLVGSAG